jgi:hypothetical protein
MVLMIGNETKWLRVDHGWKHDTTHRYPAPFILLGVKDSVNPPPYYADIKLGDLRARGQELAMRVGAVKYMECDLALVDTVHAVFNQASLYLRTVSSAESNITLITGCNIKVRRCIEEGNEDWEALTEVWILKNSHRMTLQGDNINKQYRISSSTGYQAVQDIKQYRISSSTGYQAVQDIKQYRISSRTT